MGILKQKSNYIILFIVFTFISCRQVDKNKSINEMFCHKDTIIKPYHQEEIPIIFLGKYLDNPLEGLEISHIRKGIEITKLAYTIRENDFENKSIYVNTNFDLRTRDTLIISFKSDEKIILSEFRNSAYYGGKNFLGCYFSMCMVAKDTIYLHDNSLYLSR